MCSSLENSVDGGGVPPPCRGLPRLLRRPEGRPPPSFHFRLLVEPTAMASAAPRKILTLPQSATACRAESHRQLRFSPLANGRRPLGGVCATSSNHVTKRTIGVQTVLMNHTMIPLYFRLHHIFAVRIKSEYFRTTQSFPAESLPNGWCRGHISHRQLPHRAGGGERGQGSPRIACRF